MDGILTEIVSSLGCFCLQFGRILHRKRLHLHGIRAVSVAFGWNDDRIPDKFGFHLHKVGTLLIATANTRSKPWHAHPAARPPTGTSRKTSRFLLKHDSLRVLGNSLLQFSLQRHQEAFILPCPSIVIPHLGAGITTVTLRKPVGAIVVSAEEAHGAQLAR